MCQYREAQCIEHSAIRYLSFLPLNPFICAARFLDVLFDFHWFECNLYIYIYILSGNSLALLHRYARPFACTNWFSFYHHSGNWKIGKVHATRRTADGAVDRRSLCHRCCKPQSGDNGNATINHCLLRAGKWEQTDTLRQLLVDVASDGHSHKWTHLHNTRQDVRKMMNARPGVCRPFSCHLPLSYYCFAPTSSHHRGHSLRGLQIRW